MEKKKIKELVSVEIFEVPNDLESNEIKKFIDSIQNNVLIIDDLSKKYAVNIRTIELNEENKDIKEIAIIEPEQVSPVDAYELNESIYNFGKDIGIDLSIYEDASEKAITEEMIQKFKEIVNKFKKDSKNDESRSD